MKLITFAVPSYNSQAYMKNCIESLLVGGEDVEIIIVNDGSTDDTGRIADEYAAAYPTVVRAVHKPNGGHGSGVNKGLELATGLYYKVVDSDDWLDGEALKILISAMKKNLEEGKTVDMYVANFIYDHALENERYVSTFREYFPVNRVFGWEESKPLKMWHVMLMHSLFYRTQTLRESGLVLPEHTFYVDNLFAYAPFPYVKTLCYVDVDLYHYFIGRSDQSVTIENVVKRYAQQMRVMELMLRSHSYDELSSYGKRLQKQMYHILDVILMNTYFFTTAKDTPERRQDFRNMWENLKRDDIKLYKKLRGFSKVRFLNSLTWKSRGRVTTFCYKFLCKHVKLGM